MLVFFDLQALMKLVANLLTYYHLANTINVLLRRV